MSLSTDGKISKWQDNRSFGKIIHGAIRNLDSPVDASYSGATAMLNAITIPRQLKDLLGREIGPTDWFEMTQERIDAFAAATDDRQWIHVDRERALQTPLGSTVAHGFLLLSLIPHFLQKSVIFNVPFKIAVNYGLNRVRFLNPVRPGDKIRHRAILQEITRKGFGRLLLKIDNTIEVEGAPKPALVAELLVLFFV